MKQRRAAEAGRGAAERGMLDHKGGVCVRKTVAYTAWALAAGAA